MIMHISGKRGRGWRAGLFAAVAASALLIGNVASDAWAARQVSQESAGYYGKAQGYYKNKEWRAALVELKNALKADPDNIEARLLLGETYLKLRNGPAAEKEFQQALKRGANRTDVTLRLGDAYLLQRKFQEILDQIKVEATPTKRRYDALVLRASANLGLRQLEDAKKDFEAAESFDPKDPGAKIGLARVHLINRDVDLARAKIDEALKVAPKNVEALLIRGEVSRLQNDIKQSFTYFDTAVGLEPENLAAVLGRASVLIELDRYDEARADVDAIFKQAPNHPMAHYLAARIAWQKKDIQGASDHLQAAGQALENFLPAMFLNGLVNYAQNNLEQAAFNMSRVLQFAPDHVAARRVLGMTYLKQNDPQQAIQTLEPMEGTDEADAQIYSILGYAHMQMGELDRGAYYFDKAVAEDPKAAGSRTRLAVSKLALGNVEAATDDLQKVVKDDPKALQASIILAMVHIRNNKPDEALKVAAALKKNHPTNPVGSYLEGEAYLKKKNYPAARAALAAAQKVNPQNFAPSLKLAQIDAAEGKFAEAEKRYNAILAKQPNHVVAMIGLAELADRARKPNEALSWLNKAAEVDPKNVNVRLQLVSRYVDRREFDKAQDIATRLTQTFPEEPVAYEALGKLLLVRGDAKGAITNFERLATLRPDLASAHHLLARAERAGGNLVESQESLKKAYEISPVPTTFGEDVERVGTAASVLVDLVELEAKQKRYNEALAYAADLSTKYPKSKAGEVTKANVYLEKGDFDKAIAIYNATHKANQGSTQTAINLYRAHTAKGDQASGIASLKTWLAAHSNDVVARNVLASAYISKRDYDAAIAEYEYLLAKNKKDPLALNNLAWLYFQKKDPKAAAMAADAYKLAPQSPEVIDTYAWILVNGGAVDKGLELLKKAVTLRPGSPDIRYHLAVALAKKGQKPEARRELQDLLGLGVSFAEEKEARALLNSLGK